jgi:dTMP kinase
MDIPGDILVNNQKFISFEGIDFSGKTTQINHLIKTLEARGETVILIREPGGTNISEKIRRILLDRSHDEMTSICEVFLYSAARNQLINQVIIKELQNGHVVIADRFVDSTTAYQGFGRRLPLDLIRDINKAATNSLLPSLTFILDIDPKEVLKRRINRNIDIDRLEAAGEQFYERVRKGYYKIAELDHTRVKLINAMRPIEEIKDEIWEFVKEKMDFK